MEVFCEVLVQNIELKTEILSHTAFFTFVSLNKDGNTIPVPRVEPQSSQEVELFEGALRRRELRLILAGKMSVKNASSLQSLFE